MVLESTMVCVDNSDYMRNGDFLPTRLHAQQDAVNVICMSKTRANPENNVGLLSAANNAEVLVTLTTDANKVLARLHQVQPKGQIHFTSAIRVAHLVLKHRQGKNHRMRIVVFVGSPIPEDEKEMVKLAKKLRKEKVNVDIVNFGEEASNTDKLTAFINALNGSDGNSSHLVTVPAGPLLSDALVTSQIVVGEDGSGAVPAGGFEFGIDPNEDPELALALRVSMEEQRARQEEESRKATAASAAEIEAAGNKPAGEESIEEQLLRQALARSVQQPADSGSADVEMREATGSGVGGSRDLSAMTEDEQIAYAMHMSLQQGAEAMEEDQSTAGAKTGDDDDDNSEVMSDPAFIQSVLEGLPGVNPQDEAVMEAVKQLTKPSDQSKDKGKKDEK